MRAATVARPVRDAAVTAVFIAWVAWPGSACRAADVPGAPPPSDRALELYRQGHYDDAYHAFEDMAKKNPDMGSLQFNAGASAYMGRQYDEALDAFGHALASDNPDLQAKSHYNFGNTLFRRGEEQKDREAKIKDWKNALQHYDSTLDMLKRGGKSDPLASNTAYNRDLVQKRLDEELKQPPQQQQQKQDQKDQKDQKNQDQQQQQQQQKQDQKDQQKQDQQQKQNQQNPSQGQQKSDQQNQQQQQQGKQDQPPKPDQQQKQDEQQPQQQNQPPQGQDQQKQQQSSSGKSSDQNRDANQPPSPSPSPSSEFSGADQPRQHGDFQSQPGQSPTPQPGGSPTPADSPPAEPKEESGKMSEAQARALLDSLKGEDDRVMLNGPPDNRKKQDESVIKDW